MPTTETTRPETASRRRSSAWLDEDQLAAERDLVRRAQQGDPDAQRALLERYTPLLRALARRAGAIDGVVDAEDLLAVAQGELLANLHKVDVVNHDRPLAYLLPRLKGAMIDHLRRNDPMGRRLRASRQRVARERERLEQLHGGQVDEREAAASVGVSEREVACFQLAEATCSLDGREAAGRAHQAVDPAPSAGALLEQRQAVGIALGVLEQRERLVIEQVVLAERTLGEVGAVLGISESRVHQLKTRALGRMRERLVAAAAV